MRRHRFHLNVTAKCNGHCIHCYRDGGGKAIDPPLEVINVILDRFKEIARMYYEHGYHALTVGGGEPTLRQDLEDIIALAVRRQFKVRLVTNATLIDDERAFSLRRAGLTAVQVSLDGATEKTHDLIRGEGNWKRSINGIRALKRAGVLTVLNYVLMPTINMAEAPLLLDLARVLKVGGVKFARIVPEGRARANRLRTQGDYWDAYLRILDHAQSIRYKRLLFILDPLVRLLKVQNPKATAGLWGLALDQCHCNNTELVEVDGPTGDVYYCRVRTRLGNIWADDLKQLWRQHPLLRQIRRKAPVGACIECSVWNGCRGGCPAVAKGISGQPLIQDANCQRVAQQPSLLDFRATGYSNSQQRSTTESLQGVGRKMKDTINWLVLR